MKLAIKGHPERGNEVIKLLEMLGGENSDSLKGNDVSGLYFIRRDHKIHITIPQKDYQIYTLEEFEEKYPFKVGDKVYSNNQLFYNDKGLYTVPNPFEIIYMEWNSKADTISCKIAKGNTILITTVETIKPYKPMKKEVKELTDFLKPGYVVEYNDGDRCVLTQDVHGNVFGVEIQNSRCWTCLDLLDHIVAIYRINRPGNLHNKELFKENTTQVWAKEVELTMQEIADKFGIDVNQLKIKK